MTHSNGNGGELFFRNEQIALLIKRWTLHRDEESFAQILKASEQILARLMGVWKTGAFVEPEEIQSHLHRKLFLYIHRYDPQKAEPFSYISRICVRVLQSVYSDKKSYECRYPRVDDPEIWENIPSREPSRVYSGLALEEIQTAILEGIHSTQRDRERDCQRWIVCSLLSSDFGYDRAILSAAAATVYSPVVGCDKARILFDEITVAVRRILLPHNPPKPGIADRLARTQNEWLIAYRDFTSPEQFERLSTLLKDLGTGMLPAPAGDSVEIKRAIGYVLNGHPKARPLFPVGQLAKAREQIANWRSQFGELRVYRSRGSALSQNRLAPTYG